MEFIFYKIRNPVSYITNWELYSPLFRHLFHSSQHLSIYPFRHLFIHLLFPEYLLRQNLGSNLGHYFQSLLFFLPGCQDFINNPSIWDSSTFIIKLTYIKYVWGPRNQAISYGTVCSVHPLIQRGLVHSEYFLCFLKTYF